MSVSLINFESLSIEALSEVARESFEECNWALEKALDKARNFGRILLIVRSKIPHGEWIPWIDATFEDKVSLRTIQRYMQIANASDSTLLDGAKSIDEAIKRLGTPKPAAIEEPEPDRDEPGQPSVQPEPAPTPPREPRKPQEPHQESTPIAATEVFHLGERLDEDRSAIMEMAGDYMAAGKLKHFIVMLHKAATDLENTK